MSQSFSLPIPDPLPPTVNERLLEAKHKAVTINIMFTANKAASKITSTQVGDVHNKNLILRLAPRAVTEVLKTVYGVEIPVASVEQYYVDIQQNAAYLKIPWNQDEAAKLIGSLFGTHTNNPKDIEALFHEVTTFFEHHYKVSPNSSVFVDPTCIR